MAPTSTAPSGARAHKPPSIRKTAIDPYFDNSRIQLPGKGKLVKGMAPVPYKPRNTYIAPNGDRQDYLKQTEGLTAMQRHVAFFDADCDGVIWPSDTFYGFLALGFGYVLSLLAVLIIHAPFSYPSKPTSGRRLTDWIPDPFFRIWVANIHRNKHGSDTESYNRRGDFQREKFETILQDYSTAHSKDSLSFKDGCVMILERRNLMDFFGIFAFIFEWSTTYMLLWPQDGYMKRDDMIGVINGSAFVDLAYQHKHGKGAAFKAK